eukprot:gene7736-1385_t
MQRSERPSAAAFLNLTLETKTQLKERYKGVPMFSSCEEMIADEDAMANVSPCKPARLPTCSPLYTVIDGVIICTAHADMGMKFLAAGGLYPAPQPGQTCVDPEADDGMVLKNCTPVGDDMLPTFWVYSSACFAMCTALQVDVPEARALAAAVDAAAQERNLVFMVNNTANYRDQCFEARRLVEAGELGDIHHILCVMYSPLMFLLDDPANDGWVKPTGSMVQRDGSGNGFGWGQVSHVLAWVLHVGALDVEAVTASTHRSDKGFLMENPEAAGHGPESLLNFVATCRGLPFSNGADQNVGLQINSLDLEFGSQWLSESWGCQVPQAFTPLYTCTNNLILLDCCVVINCAYWHVHYISTINSAASGKTELTK